MRMAFDVPPPPAGPASSIRMYCYHPRFADPESGPSLYSVCFFSILSIIVENKEPKTYGCMLDPRGY